jgi:hypothetical protein
MASRTAEITVKVADLPEVKQHIAELTAERDRLQAAVDAALEAWADHSDASPDDFHCLCTACEMRRALIGEEAESDAS